MHNIAVLLTCHNRRQKTLRCLESFFAAEVAPNYHFDFFIVDDGSTDGTAADLLEKYPEINLITGDGNLFWAGGMRLAYESVPQPNNYESYLLLNDDVVLQSDFFSKLLATQDYCLDKYHKGGVYSGSTLDEKSGETTYGGNLLFKGVHILDYKLVEPNDSPQICHLTNANVLLVNKEVIDEIGFLDKRFIHGIADYEFSLRAHKKGFPVYITPGHCGYCENDHGNNWSSSKSLKQRIKYLKSPLGLSYHEYLFYIKRHFPGNFAKSRAKLWLRTLFPFYLRFFK